MTPEAELQNVFNRIEKSGISSVSDIKKWLAGPNKNPSSYTNASNMFAEPFGLREQIYSAKTYEEVEDIKNSSRLMVVRDQRTLKEVDELIKRARAAQDIEVRLANVESINSLNNIKSQALNLEFRRGEINKEIDDSIEIYNEEITTAKKQLEEAKTKKEIESAEEVLREKAPKTFAQIRSLRPRRIKSAFKYIF